MRVISSLRASRRMRPLLTPHAVAAFALVSLVLLWVIVPSGAIVRLTGSGLGCPDWPLCEGRVVPASAGHQAIEYANRLLSGVVVIVALITWALAQLAPGAPRRLRWWSGIAAACGLAQAPLGAITVLSGLHPLAVGSHFLLSMVALACGTVAFREARDWRDGRVREWDRRRGPLAGITLLAALSVIVTGVVVTAAGPHPGDVGVVRTWGNLAELATIHVRIAFTFTALAVILALWLWREGGVDRLTGRLAILLVPLIAIQIGIGEYQYRHGLPWEVVIFHVSVAGLLWAVMVALVFGIARPERGVTTPAQAER